MVYETILETVKTYKLCNPTKEITDEMIKELIEEYMEKMIKEIKQEIGVK